jgi:hypothetical protein
MLEALNELKTKFEEMQKEINKQGEALLKEVFKDVFVKFPEVETFGWKQYIPGFNDGDPCEFSMRDLEYWLTPEARAEFKLDPRSADDEEDYDTEGDAGDLWSYGKDYRDKNYINPRAKEIDEFFTGLYSIISSDAFENLLQALFESNAEIIVSREGIEFDYYDCGY